MRAIKGKKQGVMIGNKRENPTGRREGWLERTSQRRETTQEDEEAVGKGDSRYLGEKYKDEAEGPDHLEHAGLCKPGQKI